jgi:hypothetical protein
MRQLLSVLIFVVLTGKTAFSLGAEQQMFALVIGSNTSFDDEIENLRYADDDAVQNAQLLKQLGAEVVLLVNLDRESKEIYSQLEATVPSWAALTAAMDKLNDSMQKARSSGKVPVFYLFYSGHGNVENNEGYVNLEGEKLRRGQLMKLINKSQASTNHIVVDACKSYFLVFDRGVGGIRKPVGRHLVVDQTELPDNTGVFLSTSSAADSHEWEAVQSGIFSHELRSALRGAADLDGDQQITYDEAAAFIWTANSSISNPRFRPKFFKRPPRESSDAEPALINLAQARGGLLHVAVGNSRHFYIEDGLGRRLADFHPAQDQQFSIRIPDTRPLFVRLPGSDQEVELPFDTDVYLAQLDWQKSEVARRGAEHLAFRLLFDKPFGQQSLSQYKNLTPEVSQTNLTGSDLSWLRQSLGVSAIILGATAGTFTGLALAEKEKVGDNTSGLELSQINSRIEKYNTVAVIGYALAGSALATYLIWTFWPDDHVEVNFMPSVEQPIQFSIRW